MFNDIEYDAQDNATILYTPEHMNDVYDDIIDRVIGWDEGKDVAYGYMFDEIERTI